MGNEVKPYGPFGTLWEAGGYEAAGMPVVDAYAATEDGMLWLADSSTGQRTTLDGKGAVVTAPRKPAVSESSTAWDVRQNSGPSVGSGRVLGQMRGVRPESVLTADEQDELAENVALQYGVDQRLRSAGSQGVRDLDAEALEEALRRRQGELKQSVEQRMALLNEQTGGGKETGETGNHAGGGQALKGETPRQAQSLGQGGAWRGDGEAQAGGGMIANRGPRRIYNDTEAGELVKIAMDSRMLAAIDDPNEPSPAVAARRAQLEERKRQINAAAEERAAGKVVLYKPEVGNPPPVGVGIGWVGEAGQPPGGRLLTSRDIELGGYYGKGPRMLPSEAKPAELTNEDGVRIMLPEAGMSDAEEKVSPKAGVQNDWVDGGKLFARNLADAPVSMLQGMYNEVAAGLGDAEWSLSPMEWQRLGELRAFREVMTRKPDPEIAKWMLDIRQMPGDPLGKVESEIAGLEKKAADAYRGSVRESMAGAYSDNAEGLGGQREMIGKFYNVDADYEQSFLGKVIAAGGQAIPQAVVAQLPYIGKAVLQGQAYQQALDDARETAARTGQRYDEKKAREYAFANALQGMLLDGVNIDGTVGKWLKEGGESTLRKALTHVMVGAGTGVVTNPLQGALSDIQASEKGIEERKWFDPERRGDDILIGLATNTPMSLGIAGARGVDHYNSFEQKVRREAGSTERGKPQAGDSNGGGRGAGGEGATGSKNGPRFAQGREVHEELGRQWLELAKDERTRVLGPTPEDKDIPGILDKLGGPSARRVAVEPLPDGEGGFKLSDPKGFIEVKPLSGNRFYVNSRDAGKESTLIYQAIYAWAHNNGKRIVEDPGGLTEDGVARRPSQMLSSALRFGTTRHMEPGPHSWILGWRSDDTPEATAHNVGLLADFEAETLRLRLPKLSDLRYDLETGSIYDGKQRIPDDRIREYLTGRISEADPNFAERIGDRTLRRALASLAAREAIESGRALQLVGPTARAPQVLEKSRYSRRGSEADAPEGRQELDKLEGIRRKLQGEGRRETARRAVEWQRMFRAIAPGAARELELKITSRHEAAKQMAGIESALTGQRVEYNVPEDAHAAIHRDTIYLFQEALGEYRRNGNELSEGIRRVQHETVHDWWSVLSNRERDALTLLWKAETSNKRGPLYDAEGRLKPGVMAGVESDVQEWFAERGAMANDEWAQKRAAIADHDGSPVGSVMATLRGWLFDARQAIAPNLSRDVIADELRGVLRRGTAARKSGSSLAERIRSELQGAASPFDKERPGRYGGDLQRNREAAFVQIHRDREFLFERISDAEPGSLAANSLKEQLQRLDAQLAELQGQEDAWSNESDDPRYAKKSNVPKKTSWEEVRNGDRWNSVKRLLPKEQVDAPFFDIRGSKDEVVARAAEFLRENPVVQDRKGRMVYLPNGQTEGSYGDPVLNRAEHVTGADERPGTHSRTLDIEKARWLAAVPETIRNAPVRVHDGNVVMYFRNYRGVTHQVTTGAEGVVIDQRTYDSGLVTQYPRDLREKQFGDDARVVLLPSQPPSDENPED